MPKKFTPARTPRKVAAERQLKTLERVLSKAGAGSRTDARSWIGGGRVKVNGKVEQNPDRWVDLDTDRVTLDGKPLKAAAKLYILLYKPKGYLTTYRDPEGRPTVYDLTCGDVGAWLSPVGRLDLDTSGLLMMTSSRSMISPRVLLTNPVHHVPKTYQLKASTVLSDEAAGTLAAGSGIERWADASGSGDASFAEHPKYSRFLRADHNGRTQSPGPPYG